MHKQTARAQITVNGTITGENGNSLKSVIVTVKESGKTTTTNKNGDYSIIYLDN